jgi:hypothetical protein
MRVGALGLQLLGSRVPAGRSTTPTAAFGLAQERLCGPAGTRPGVAQQRLCLSSLKERGRSIPRTKIVSMLCVVPSVEAGTRQPADGFNGEARSAARTSGPGTSRADAEWKRSRDGLPDRWSPSSRCRGGWQLYRQQPLPIGFIRHQPRQLQCRSPRCAGRSPLTRWRADGRPPTPAERLPTQTPTSQDPLTVPAPSGMTVPAPS